MQQSPQQKTIKYKVYHYERIWLNQHTSLKLIHIKLSHKSQPKETSVD